MALLGRFKPRFIDAIHLSQNTLTRLIRQLGFWNVTSGSVLETAFHGFPRGFVA